VAVVCQLNVIGAMENKPADLLLSQLWFDFFVSVRGKYLKCPTKSQGNRISAKPFGKKS
jgi:hypothetical protein